MKKHEILEKAQKIEETMDGLTQLEELGSYVYNNDCGCGAEEWKELREALDQRRREIKSIIKKNR